MEEQKTGRIAYWSEVSDFEKIRRLREYTKRQEREILLLMEFMRHFQAHQHGKDGEVLVPLFMKDRLDLPNANLSQGDDVYF